jgi:hypothetical protein
VLYAGAARDAGGPGNFPALRMTTTTRRGYVGAAPVGICAIGKLGSSNEARAPNVRLLVLPDARSVYEHRWAHPWQLFRKWGLFPLTAANRTPPVHVYDNGVFQPERLLSTSVNVLLCARR